LSNRRETTIRRSNFYRILASAFSPPRPETESVYDALLEAHSILHITEDPSEQTGASQGFPALAREHLRLFVGPGHVPCAPYEAVHRKDRPDFEKGLVMGPSTAEVRRTYLAAGLEVSKTYTDLPDHIAAEMEFMHFLCAEESKFERNGNQQEAAKMKWLQQEFHKSHLEPWVKDFADCILRSTTSPFYKAAARVLKEFAGREAEFLTGAA